MIAWRQSPVLLEVTTIARYFLVEVEVGRNHMMSNEKTHVFGVEMREVNRFFPFFFSLLPAIHISHLMPTPDHTSSFHQKRYFCVT